MRLLSSVAVFCLFLLPAGVFAQEPATWKAHADQGKHFASYQTPRGVTAIIGFETGAKTAELFISGLWPTRPLDLRLFVRYANGSRAYIDTFRFGKILKTRSGETAYTMVMPFAQLRPLRGGDILVIEDLNQRTEVPLTGSAKAITAAQNSASGG